MAYASYNFPTDNVASSATVTLGSADSQYPASYAVDWTDVNLGRPSKSTLVTDDWVFDFGSAKRIDIVALWHNFDGGLACSWQGNATNSWGAPTLSTAFTIPTVREDGYHPKPFLNLTGVTGYSTSGFRFWRLHVTGTNSVVLGVKVWLGNVIRTLDRPVERNLHQAEHHTYIDLVTDGQAHWLYDLQAAPRVFNGKINGSATTLAALKSWIRSAGLRVKPSLLIPDPTVNDAWIVRWMGQPSVSLPTGGSVESGTADFTYLSPGAFPITVAWDEVSPGAPEWL